MQHQHRLPLADATSLAGVLDKLTANDRDFALSLINAQVRYGSLTPKQAAWVPKLLERATKPAPAAVKVGTMEPLVALLAKAGQHLKQPAVRLHVAGLGDIRLSVAGPNSRAPGSINVAEPGFDGRWFGRVTAGGLFEANRRQATPPGLVEKLLAFAADPAGVAGADGRLTGRCCFCGRHLEDERSTAVGYGPVCADNYGLPWGETP